MYRHCRIGPALHILPESVIHARDNNENENTSLINTLLLGRRLRSESKFFPLQPFSWPVSSSVPDHVSGEKYADGRITRGSALLPETNIIRRRRIVAKNGAPAL